MKNTTSKALAKQVDQLNPYDLIDQAESVRADEMGQFTDALNKIWQLTNMLPSDQVEGAQQALRQMWESLKQSNTLVDAMGTRMKRQDAIITGLDASLQEAARQRDGIADAFADHLLAVENGEHPAVQKQVDKAVMEAFEQFQANHARLTDLAKKLTWPTSEAG